MEVMKAARTHRIAAVVVALVCMTSVLVDCHGDCHQDDCSAYCAGCSHVCRCATIQVCSVDLNPTYATIGNSETPRDQVGLIAPVFHPPNPAV